MAFWFVQVDALRWIVLQLEQEFTRYPLSIYTRGVRLLLAFVIPFGFMNYFPASYFLHKADNGLGLPIAVGVLTPAVGLVFLLIAYACWRFGLAALPRRRVTDGCERGLVRVAVGLQARSR